MSTNNQCTCNFLIIKDQPFENVRRIIIKFVKLKVVTGPFTANGVKRDMNYDINSIESHITFLFMNFIPTGVKHFVDFISILSY